MTASGSCEICNGVATHYVSQLKVWRCDEHNGGFGYGSPEHKMKELQDHIKNLEPKKKPKKGNSPFGKKYF